MENALNKKMLFSLSKISLQKKGKYSKKLNFYVPFLKSFLIKKQKFKELSLFLKKRKSSVVMKKKKGVVILYSVCFCFSAINTFLHVTDAIGRLKFSSSAGLVGFKGKSKKIRFQILKLFIKELSKLKLKFLKNNPISLHLNNVYFHRRFIIRKLKKFFFIKVIKNYQPYSYNGCRRKKKIRK